MWPLVLPLAAPLLALLVALPPLAAAAAATAAEPRREAGFWEGFMDEPIAILAVPMPGASPSARAAAGGSVVSQETVMRSDGQGHAVKKTRVCKNGACEEHTEAHDLPEDGASRHEMAMSTEKEMPFMADAFAPIARHLRGAFGQLGRNFEDEDGFFGNAALGQDDQFPLGKDAFRAALADGSINSGSSSSSSTVGAAQGQSRSMSTETVMENGHLVERVTECVNGACTTKMITGDQPEKAQQEDELAAPAAAPPEQKNIMPF